MLKINMPQFKQWIAALDSGEYKQCQLQLSDGIGYCCMGVGCKVLIHQSLQYILHGKLSGAFPQIQPAAPKWLKNINDDFEEKAGYSLAKLNDSMGYTFPEIATLLELVYIHKILD